MKKIKPFIKWAGGKTQLLPVLLKKISYASMIYIEPFVGGGALFFSILESLEETNIKKIIINDINKKLITTYRVIRDDVNSLMDELFKLETRYNSLATIEEKEKIFYLIRKQFNLEESDSIKIARDFIFLNKSCYNGLYRENSRGEFNVPFGKKKKLNLFERENLLLISQKLNMMRNNKRVVEIREGDYFILESEISETTFFYLDPPYRPITKNGFVTYNKSSFNDKQQEKLAVFCKKIARSGGKFLLSNSDPKNLDINDNFFDELYKEFFIERIEARRNINSKGDERGKVKEILIKNYTNENKLKLF